VSNRYGGPPGVSLTGTTSTRPLTKVSTSNAASTLVSIGGSQGNHETAAGEGEGDGLGTAVGIGLGEAGEAVGPTIVDGDGDPGTAVPPGAAHAAITVAMSAIASVPVR
jgi:hypothetical protein